MAYTYQQVYDASLNYFNQDELAAKTYTDKYALKKINEEGETIFFELTPQDSCKRIAKELNRIEKKYPNDTKSLDYLNLLDDFKYFILQGSPMAMIGNKHQVGSLSNCVVVPDIHDSYGGILFTDQQLVQLSKRRCGVGISLDGIRPSGAKVENAALTSSGILGFMERFSNSTREVGQNGRRGALMLSANIARVDIEDFIDAKQDLTKVTGANVSVFLTDKFMKSVKRQSKFTLQFPVRSDNPTITKEVDAKILYDKIIHNAWKTAEPGVLFYDACREYTPAFSYVDDGFDLVSTNPCSEIPLNNDSCRLGVINLTSFVNDKFTTKAKFDFKHFSEIVMKSMRAMDNLVDLEIEAIDRILKKIHSDPEPEHIKHTEILTWTSLKENAVKGRRTGLGITGLGDTLAMIGLGYGSVESFKFIKQLFKTKCVSEYFQSCMLAKERGAFPIYSYKKELDNKFINNIRHETIEYEGKTYELDKLLKKYGRRNIAISTIAPVGSVSILAQCTSGVEPVFEYEYVRRKKIIEGMKDVKVDFVDASGDKWQEFKVRHHGYDDWLTLKGHNENAVQTNPYKNSTANSINWENSVKLMSIAQKYIDHSISKTVNLPESIDKDEVGKLYTLAWESGLKGLTIYRDNCRSGVLVRDNDQSNNVTTLSDREEFLTCDIHKVTIKGDVWLCFVGVLNGKPYELFTGLDTSSMDIEHIKKYCSIRKRTVHKQNVYDLYISKDNKLELLLEDITHKFTNEKYKISTRLISLLLRTGIDLDELVMQLQKIKDDDLTAFNKVISRVIRKYIKSGTLSSSVCPQCEANTLVYSEGCNVCKSCGYAGCS